jgi:hypothetical protein
MNSHRRGRVGYIIKAHSGFFGAKIKNRFDLPDFDEKMLGLIFYTQPLSAYFLYREISSRF